MDWVDVNERLPEDRLRKYLVKKVNGEEFPAFFMPDKIIWIAFYGMKTSYWMKEERGELIHDVTHWKLKPKS